MVKYFKFFLIMLTGVLLLTGCPNNGGSSDDNESNSVDNTTFKSTLKKTGQSTSYAQFDDGEYQIGLTPNYTRDVDIVTDNITKLHWQDDSNAMLITKNWDDSKNYCSNLILNLKSDWRLPTRKELKNIIDYEQRTLLSSSFLNISSDVYWTSTTFKGSSIYKAWGIHFGSYGVASTYDKTQKLHIRCVREE